VVAGSSEALARLRPLTLAHRNYRAVREVKTANFSDSDLDDALATLVVGKPPKSAFLRAGNDRQVPTGWLPDSERLETFAHAASEVQLRRTSNTGLGPFVLLGESEERALGFAGRLAGSLSDSAPVFQWTAERIGRRDLIEALQGGAGAAFYVGRGTAAGWAGYCGFDAGDARLACGHPIGAVLSLTCSALGLSHEMVLSGLCAAALGAAGPTIHSHNVTLAFAISRALRCGASSLADILLAPDIPCTALNPYRIIGDPLAPLIGHPQSLEHAQRILAPPPNVVLPVIPLSSWK
jgi:hypothetical protein